MQFSKLRGQHFLTDRHIVEKIIAAAELSSKDTVLEVGPGLGVMTREILPRVDKLIAIELDPFFVHELRKEFEANPRIDIIEADILQMRISDLVLSSRRKSGSTAVDSGVRRNDEGVYKVVTNLPYNITSAFLKKFLFEPPHPERIVVMLQKEVAEKISASSGMLGLMCNLYAECSFVCKVSSSSFAPPPKVESAVICLKPYSESAFKTKWGFDHGQAEDLLAFASKFFSSPRKKMCGMMGKALAEKCRSALHEIGESPDSRPAVLSIENWVKLWKKLR